MEPHFYFVVIFCKLARGQSKFLENRSNFLAKIMSNPNDKDEDEAGVEAAEDDVKRPGQDEKR